MKFALVKEHRDYFAHNHYIEFEEVLSCKETSLLEALIKIFLLKRLKKPLFSETTFFEQYRAGRDLWREDIALQKIILSRRLAEVAASLFKQPLLRIAFDQYCDQTFSLSLQQMSCIDPIAAAIALPLNNPKGSAFFFSPTKPLKFSFLEQPVLIIAYTIEKARYFLKNEDPNTHLLKKLGYTFGDLVTNETHPILFR